MGSCITKKGGVLGGAQPPPPNCYNNAHIMGFNRSYALKQACIAKNRRGGGVGGGGWGGGLGGAQPLAICKHDAPMMGFNHSYALKRACTAKKGGGVGGDAARPPPHLQTQCSHHRFQSFILVETSGMMGVNRSYALQKLARLKKAGGWGGAAPPPHLACFCLFHFLYFFISFLLSFSSVFIFLSLAVKTCGRVPRKNQ